MITDHNLILTDIKPEEISQIYQMEQNAAPQFIIPYTLERHQIELLKSEVVYKSIWHSKKLIGFLILVLEADGKSVEFRRIVICKPERRYGKQVVRMVDQVCRNEFSRSRVWLNVFETNKRAQHVYESCGYKQFGVAEHEGKNLQLYEKEV